MSYKYLAMASHHSNVFSLKALIDIRWLGDNRKESFRNEWNSVLTKSGTNEVGSVMED